jgi:predicted O-methyltransferase YrrM
MPSPLTDWIAQLFSNPDMLRMGHQQRAGDLNLGLGWLYYGLTRIVRPNKVVVIGSWRGYTPLLFGRALLDNGEGGSVLFIDPSLADGQWSDPEKVEAHFASYGVANIIHRRMTTQEFVRTEEHRTLENVGLVFIDGMHTAEQAAFDFQAFEHCLSPDGIVLLHDSVKRRISGIYGPDKRYEHTVVDFISELKSRPEWQVFDLPFGDAVTLVRRSHP